MTPPPAQPASRTPDPDAPVRVDLRILATTDLHACLTPWDYYAHRLSFGRGLSRTASLIAAARSEVENSVLFDNGDFLAGSGLGDYMASREHGDLIHPMIAAMNHLRYDAVNLGNHEFSHGVPHLRKVLAQANFPVLSANFDFDDLPSVKRSVLVHKTVRDAAGGTHVVKIGVFGLLPVQTLRWEAKNLQGAARSNPMFETAMRKCRKLRDAGADIVIALAHTGVEQDLGLPHEENMAQAIAELPGIDAVIAGHSHQAFPKTAEEAAPLALVSAGFYGSHLGVIDLQLQRHPQQGGWQVLAHRSALRPISKRDPVKGTVMPLVADDPAILALSQPTHLDILADAERAIGQIPHRLHSYFAAVTSAPAMAMIAAAQKEALTAELAGTSYAGLPILSAVAPFKAGGRGGAENYTDLPAGNLCRHHIADLYVHPNTLVGFHLTGADLAQWLERSVSLYHQITPGAQDAELIHPDYPSFNLDSIFGVTYQIDLSQPPMFDASGALLNPKARRVVGLSYQGHPVQSDQAFVVASHSFRRDGIAGFAGTTQAHVIADHGVMLRHILRDHITEGRAIPVADAAHWRFCPMPDTTVLFSTSPTAREVVAEISAFRPVDLGQDRHGFLRFRLQL